MKFKKLTDLIAMVACVVAIVTGLMLHNEVHHQHIFNGGSLRTVHEISGLLLLLAVVCHCVQHKFWFKNYGRIPAAKKRVTTIFLTIAAIEFVTGLCLMFASRTEEISGLHLAAGILFLLLAIGHTAKRWRIFRKI